MQELYEPTYEPIYACEGLDLLHQGRLLLILPQKAGRFRDLSLGVGALPLLRR